MGRRKFESWVTSRKHTVENRIGHVRKQYRFYFLTCTPLVSLLEGKHFISGSSWLFLINSLRRKEDKPKIKYSVCCVVSTGQHLPVIERSTFLHLQGWLVHWRHLRFTIQHCVMFWRWEILSNTAMRTSKLAERKCSM